MPWRTLTPNDITSRFTASEQAMLSAAAGTPNYTGGMGLTATKISSTAGAGLKVDVMVQNGIITAIVPNTGNAGTGWLTGDTMTFTDATGTGFIGTVTAAGGVVSAIAVTVLGSGSKLATRLADSIGKFLGALAANHQNISAPNLAANAVPDQLRNHIMADACWEWLKDYPNLKVFQDDQRKQAAADAQKVFEKICLREFGAIEDPNPPTMTGNWQSRPKLVMRTDPIPSATQQLQITPTPIYTNPTGPSDVDSDNNPTGLAAAAGGSAGQITLTWTAVAGANSYLIYRGTVTAQESVTPIAASVAATFTDTGLTSGTEYFYNVIAVLNAGLSNQSAEASATAP